jgi:hypothetical protein
MLALVLLVASLLYFRIRSAADPEAIALPRVMSYTPLLLFSSALVLLVTYLPFARVFQMYLIGQEMAGGFMIGPPKDPGLLSMLSNLQAPFLFLTGFGVHLVLGIALVSVLAIAVYSFRHTRATPART